MTRGGKSPARLAAAAALWLVVLAVIAGGWYFGVRPYRAAQAERQALAEKFTSLTAQARRRGLPVPRLDIADASRKQLSGGIAELELTLTRGTPAPADHAASAGRHETPAGEARSATTAPPARPLRRIKLALDSFSGYAVLRSEAMRRQLALRGLELELLDDQADYTARYKALSDGSVPLATSTVDALLTAAARAGDAVPPATIVMIIDETAGADAMIAPRAALPNIDALNDPRTTILAVGGSPSETLARVVLANFDLSRLRPGALEIVPRPEDVLSRLDAAKPDDRTAFVLWEPLVSRGLEKPGMHVLIDSSRFGGYIVDVLVASRAMIVNDAPTLQAVVECYFRALYELSRRPGGLTELIRADAAALGQPLSGQQAARLADGIRFRATIENYAALGIGLPPDPASAPRPASAPTPASSPDAPGTALSAEAMALAGIRPLPRVIQGIWQVLTATGGIPGTTPLRPESFYYDGVLRALHAEAFHPERGAGAPQASADAQLPPLDEAGWSRLVPVGTLAADRIVFPRGQAALAEPARVVIARLADILNAFHGYYVIVRGHARADGDPEANRRLARARARAVVDDLISRGIPQARIRAETSATDTDGPAVTFIVGTPPF